MRTCSKCKEVKDTGLFKLSRGKPTNTCKECANASSTAWAMENKDKVKEHKRKYTAAHPRNTKERLQNDPAFREKRLEAARKYYRSNPIGSILTSARNRAEKQGVPFDIQISDIVVPKYCPILGLELRVSSGKPCDSSPSIDRIIPSLGYTVNNIQVISNLANRMKTNATPEQLKMFAIWILNNEEKFQGAK